MSATFVRSGPIGKTSNSALISCLLSLMTRGKSICRGAKRPRIELLSKTLKVGDNPASGEWTLAPTKDGQGSDLLTFSLDGVTIQSVRELYK